MRWEKVAGHFKLSVKAPRRDTPAFGATTRAHRVRDGSPRRPKSLSPRSKIRFMVLLQEPWPELNAIVETTLPLCSRRSHLGDGLEVRTTAPDIYDPSRAVVSPWSAHIRRHHHHLSALYPYRRVVHGPEQSFSTEPGCSGSRHELHRAILRKNHTIDGCVKAPRPMGPNCTANFPDDNPAMNCYRW